MVKLVDIGQYGSLSFDDDATDAEIKTYIDDNYKEISNRLNIPPEPVGPLAKMLPFNSVERGFRNAQIAFNMLQLELGLDDIQNAVYDIRRYQQRQAEIPIDREDAETLQKVTEADTLGGAMSALGDNLSVIGPLIGESIGTYLPTLAVGGGAALATRGLLGRIVGALTTGSGSGATEYGLSIVDAFNEAGVDINDGGELADALSDEDKLAEAKEFALARGVPIGAFDAVAFGSAGLLTKALKTGAKVNVGKKTAAAMEFVPAAGFGSLGEAVAQIQSLGEIKSPGAVALEGIAEGPLSLVEVGLAGLKKDVDTTDNMDKPLALEYKPQKQIGQTVKEEGPKLLTFQPEDIVGEGFTGKKRSTSEQTAERGIAAKIYNLISDIATQGTKDGTNYRKISPTAVLKSLGSAEREFLRRKTDDKGVTFVKDVLEDLVKNKKIDKSPIYGGDKAKGVPRQKKGFIYHTKSPYDTKTQEEVKQAEINANKRKQQPKKKTPIKLSKPRLQFTSEADVQQNIQDYKFNDNLNKIIDNAVTDLPESVQEKTKQFLTMAEADKRGTVKNIHATNQGNKVVGQIQNIQIKLPGYLKSLVAAINPNNPDDTKFFEETDQDGNKGEAKAIEYLNSKIGNQTVDVETVEDINEMPNFSVEEKESDISIPDLIRVQNNKTTKAFSQAKDKPNKKTVSDDKQITGGGNNFSNEFTQQADEMEERFQSENADSGGTGGTPPPPGGQPPSDQEPPSEEPRLDQNVLQQIRRDQSSRIDTALDFFKGPLNSLKKFGSWFTSANFIGRHNKGIALYNTLLNLRTQSRSEKMERQAAILKPWTNLKTKDRERKVGLAAVYSLAYKTILQPNENGEIVISVNDFNRTDGQNERGQDVGLTLVNLAGTINEDLVLDAQETEAYLSLAKVQEYRRADTIMNTLDSLKRRLSTDTDQAIFEQMNVSMEDLLTREGLDQLVENLNEIANNLRDMPEATELLKRASKRIKTMVKNADTLYFPLSRRGDRFVAVTENVRKENGQIVRRTKYFETFDSKDGSSKIVIDKANRIAEQLRIKYDPTLTVTDRDGNVKPQYEHSGIQTNTINELEKSVDANFYESLEAFIAMMPNSVRLGNETVEAMLKKAATLVDVKGTPTFFRTARLIPGYDFDNVLVSLSDSITSYATWASHFEFETKIIDAKNAVVNDEATTAREIDYIEKLDKYINEDPHEFQNLRQLGFMFFLTDVSAATMNTFQGLPAMTYISAYGGMRKSAAGQVKAMKDVMKLLKPFKELKNLSNDSAISLEKVIEKYGSTIPRLSKIENILGSVIAPNRTNEYLNSELDGIMRDSDLNTQALIREGKLKSEKIFRIMGTMFTTTEVLNRLATYINSYELTRNNNVLHKALKFNAYDQNFNAAIQAKLGVDTQNILDNFDTFIQNQDNLEALRDQVAQTAVEETQFLYGREAKPRVTRGWGALLLQFSEYPTMMLQLMWKLGFNRGPEGRKAMAMYGVALILTSGLMGLPFAEDSSEIAELAYKWYSGKNINIEEEYYKVLEGIVSPNVAEALLKGQLNMAGLSIGPRVGLGTHPVTGGLIDVFFGDGGINKASVPALSIGRGLFDALNYMQVDDAHMATASVLPKPFANFVKATALKQGGYRTRNGEVIVPPQDVSNYSAFLQALGFTPTEIARQREMNYLMKSGKDPAALLRQRFYRREQVANAKKDRGMRENRPDVVRSAERDLRELAEDLREHNEKARLQGEYNLMIRLDPKTSLSNINENRRGMQNTFNNQPLDSQRRQRERMKYMPQ